MTPVHTHLPVHAHLQVRSKCVYKTVGQDRKGPPCCWNRTPWPAELRLPLPRGCVCSAGLTRGVSVEVVAWHLWRRPRRDSCSPCPVPLRPRQAVVSYCSPAIGTPLTLTAKWKNPTGLLFLLINSWSALETRDYSELHVSPPWRQIQYHLPGNSVRPPPPTLHASQCSTSWSGDSVCQSHGWARE